MDTTTSPISSFDLKTLKWIRFEDRSDPAVPVDVWTAILGCDAKAGRADLLVKLEPDAYYPFHRHLGDTISIVLEGEHHVEETKAGRTTHKVRPPGHYGCTPAGDAHIEHAGPNGSLVFFSVQAKDGRLFETLDKDQNVLQVTTIADVLSAL
jgi:quercetin dioxygenase-like cupin family protein